ncbi:hypothetical protein ACFE04_018714 [Oxalis oulophora]
MASNYKGNNNGNGSNIRRRYVLLMLLLAFGAALLGVMILHKLRETRIFNLILNDKDQQLLSLTFLYKKEKDYTKELKTKTQHMKANLLTLRTEKMELDRRVLELQSTIASLKDEEKTMESTMEEQQNEIKMLRAKDVDLREETPQVVDLTKMLKQKDAEIEDLKHRLQLSVKVWSVSTDDPSNPPVNLTMSTEQKENGEESNSRFDEATNYKEGSWDAETKFKDIDAVTVGDKNSDNINMTGKVELEKLEISQEEAGNFHNGQRKRNEYSQHDGLQMTGREIVIRNETKDDGVFMSSNGNKRNDIQQVMQGGLRNFQEDKGQNVSVNSAHGGMKLETTDNSEAVGFGIGVNHAHPRKSKGKRWRTFNKNRMLGNKTKSENHETAKKHARRLSINGLSLKRTKETVPDNGHVKEEGGVGSENRQVRKTVSSWKVRSSGTQEFGEAEYLKTNSIEGQVNQIRNEETKSTVDEPRQAEDKGVSKMQGNTNSLDEVRQPDDKVDSGSHEKLNSIEKVDGLVKRLNIDELEKGEEMANEKDSNPDAASDDFFSSKLEEDREAYQEETDETEF